MVYSQIGNAITKYETRKVQLAIDCQKRRDQNKEKASKMAEQGKQANKEKKQVKE